jgi:hypothetical protein
MHAQLMIRSDILDHRLQARWMKEEIRGDRKSGEQQMDGRHWIEDVAIPAIRWFYHCAMTRNSRSINGIDISTCHEIMKCGRNDWLLVDAIHVASIRMLMAKVVINTAARRLQYG